MLRWLALEGWGIVLLGDFVLWKSKVYDVTAAFLLALLVGGASLTLLYTVPWLGLLIVVVWVVFVVWHIAQPREMS